MGTYVPGAYLQALGLQEDAKLALAPWNPPPYLPEAHEVILQCATANEGLDTWDGFSWETAIVEDVNKWVGQVGMLLPCWQG